MTMLHGIANSMGNEKHLMKYVTLSREREREQAEREKNR